MSVNQCVLDHNKVKGRKLIWKKVQSFWKTPLKANTFLVHVQKYKLCKRQLFKSLAFLRFICLVSGLSESYVSFSMTPPSPNCHAPLSGSLLCSALKAMCARSCSCGLPDVDQQSSNNFYGTEFTHFYLLLHRTEEHKIIH